MINSKEVVLTDMKLSDNAQVFTSQTFTGKVQRRFSGIQYYTLKFSAQYNKKDIAVVKRFLTEYRFGKPFNLPLPKYSGSTSTVTGNVAAAIAAPAGSRKVKLSGFTGQLDIGTVIQFANHKKLYQVASDTRGNGELSIVPNLRAAVQVGELIKYRNIEGSFILTTDSVEWPQTELQTIELEATENV